MKLLQRSANIDVSVYVSIRCCGHCKPTRHRLACLHATASLLLTFGVVCFVVFIESHAEGQSAELADPIPVLVDGKPLDVERLGCAAPCVFDFDRDGLADLLVGEKYSERLRIYRNEGTREEPRFSGFSLFQDGTREGCAPLHCHGFRPVVSDIDGDGLVDIVTSTEHLGYMVVFRQHSLGQFSASQPISDSEAEKIHVSGMLGGIAAVDWDADGRKDIVAGILVPSPTGSVFLLRNVSEGGELQFSKPTPVLSGGQPISVPAQHAMPVVVDWNRDGLFDLLIGCDDGSVVAYYNVGDATTPKFEESQLLIEAIQEGRVLGTLLHICATDWNGDGTLDLLIGDCGEQFGKVIDSEEQQSREQAAEKQAEALKSWARYYRLFNTSSESNGKPGKLPVAESLRAAMMRANQEQSRYYREQRAIYEGDQTHGRVWVYLRQ